MAGPSTVPGPGPPQGNRQGYGGDSDSNGGNNRKLIVKGGFYLANFVLSLSLVILGILLWNHCPSENGIPRCIVGESGDLF